jgi:hypothetical protein
VIHDQPYVSTLSSYMPNRQGFQVEELGQRNQSHDKLRLRGGIAWDELHVLKRGIILNKSICLEFFSNIDISDNL